MKFAGSMSRLPRLASAALLTLSVAGMAWAMQPPAERPAQQPANPGRPPGGPGGPGGERPGRGPGQQGNVEGAMRGMNRVHRQLAGQITDAAKKDENLRLVSDMQRGAAAAKGAPLPESIVKGKDDAAKAVIAKEFRRDLRLVLRTLLDVEEAIEEGNGAVAKTKLDEVVKLSEAAHKRLGVREEGE